tara:strand:+ start:760 stop:969 length:210 start_codon:yes stop_codon:yes gene_type:complete
MAAPRDKVVVLARRRGVLEMAEDDEGSEQWWLPKERIVKVYRLLGKMDAIPDVSARFELGSPRGMASPR